MPHPPRTATHAPTSDPHGAPKVLAPNEGEARRVLADLVTTKLAAHETRGAYSLFETRTVPWGAALRQRQTEVDATFVVLEGSYAVRVGDRVRTVGVGGVVFVPRGTVHSYANLGATPARMLVIASPGGAHERFYAEAGAPAVGAPSGPGGGPPDVAPVIAAAARHGIEILPAE
jgi:mannose-6-phosphate isomerase-like protein (cupin superfamily)